MAIPDVDQRTTAKAILISMVAAVGGFLFGFDTAVINGAVDPIQSAFGLSPALTGFAVSGALLGSALGAWYAGRVADRLGRVRAMIVAAVLFAISAVGAGLAFSVWPLIGWRFVGGVGVGMASVIAPAYIAEVAPSHIRGRLGSLQQLAIVSGIFVALLSDAFLATVAGGAGQQLWFGLAAWRWMFLVGLVPALAYGVLALQIPESPRYLVAKGELVRAGEVLGAVLGSRSVEAVQRKVQDIAASLRRESQRSARLSDLRGSRFGLLPIVWVGILLSVFQQFVGINVIFSYSDLLWEAVGFGEKSSFTIALVTTGVNVLITLVAIALIDRLGRRPLLLAGSAGMSVMLATMTVVFAGASTVNGQPRLDGAAGVIALVAADLFVVAFAVSWGPVLWVLLGEMFPNRIRSAALGLASGVQWMANWTIAVTFPALRHALVVAYGFYTLCAVLSLVFVWRWVRETNGVSLEDMPDEVSPTAAPPAAT
jgi:SP family sugar:H+ symporter-like MFS transporter